MTPDMKRLVETVENVFLPMRLDYLEGHEAEAIVRAVLTELREVSHASADAAWDGFCWLGPDRCDGDPEPTPEAVVAVVINHILAEPTAPR